MRWQLDSKVNRLVDLLVSQTAARSRAVRNRVAMIALGWLVATSPAFAQSSDAAYCAKLGDFVLRYCGNNGGEGGQKPDIAITLAIENCNTGNVAASIATLEAKIRSKGFSLPKR